MLERKRQINERDRQAKQFYLKKWDLIRKKNRTEQQVMEEIIKQRQNALLWTKMIKIFLAYK